MATPCTPPSIDITYAAHTASCTFLLDSEGICRRIVVQPTKGKRSAGRTAARCVGAQYVASLDGSAAGGLVEMPRVGAAMLFARVDERGRVTLVRTGVVTSFESHARDDQYDPFAESGAVETSAPELVTPRVAGPAPSVAARHADPDYDDDPSEKTQRIQALRPADIAAALGEHGGDDADPGHDLATAEYRTVVDELPPRQTLPSTRAISGAPTLRNPHLDATIEDDDAYARPRTPTPSRGVLPRRSDPRMRAAARSYAAPETSPAPQAYSSDIQVSRRRRGT